MSHPARLLAGGVRTDPAVPSRFVAAIRPTPVHPPKRPLVDSARAARTTITLKLLMAASGVAFIGFVLAHMYGNLKAFSGEESFNDYAEHLREIGEPLLPYSGLLWILRVGLILALVVHVACAVALTRRAQRARTQKYAVRKYANSTLSSRTMRWGGVTILVFLVWHLINFTVVKVNITGGETQNPYRLMVDTFGVWWMTLIYLAAMVALGMHLRHGVWSSAQTLGLTNNQRARRNFKVAGIVLAVVVAGGFSLVPIFTLAGVIS
jgi:succinate dehydrogenase / fumarate reductase, cytochrome b subunit